jgi:hypothetical protein
VVNASIVIVLGHAVRSHDPTLNQITANADAIK